MRELDCIYLTKAQIATLTALTEQSTPHIGVQIRSTADEKSLVFLDCVMNDGNLWHAFIDADGETRGWEC